MYTTHYILWRYKFDVVMTNKWFYFFVVNHHIFSRFDLEHQIRLNQR